MSNPANQTNEVLVLTGEGGEIYAIPREVVEQHRVTGSNKTEIETQLEDEVSGYTMYQNFVAQQTAGYHQSEARQAAAEARMARQAQMDDASAAGQPSGGGSAAGIRGALVGVWRTLSSIRPASSNP
jgi:hypothetical protein